MYSTIVDNVYKKVLTSQFNVISYNEKQQRSNTKYAKTTSSTEWISFRK